MVERIENNDFFRNVPIELIRYIATYLDETSLLLLAKTCKRFHSLIFKNKDFQKFAVNFAPNLMAVLDLNSIHQTAHVEKAKTQTIIEWLQREQYQLASLKKSLDATVLNMQEQCRKAYLPPAEIIELKNALENLPSFFKLKAHIKTNLRFFKKATILLMFVLISIVVLSPFINMWHKEAHQYLNQATQSPAYDAVTYSEAGTCQPDVEGHKECQRSLDNYEKFNNLFLWFTVGLGIFSVGTLLFILLSYHKDRDRRTYLELPVHRLELVHQQPWTAIANTYRQELSAFQINTIGDIVRFLRNFGANKSYSEDTIKQGRQLLSQVQSYEGELNDSIIKKKYSPCWKNGEPKLRVFQNANNFFQLAKDYKPQNDSRVIEVLDSEQEDYGENETDLLLQPIH